MTMFDPPHPGPFIRAEIIEPLGLSVTAAAVVLDVSRPALSNLLNSKAQLTGEMALRIERAFDVKMETLMRMQSAYDIAQTRKVKKRLLVKRYQSERKNMTLAKARKTKKIRSKNQLEEVIA